MQKLIPVLAVLAVAALSGCVGYEDGTIGLGSTVLGSIEVQDLDGNVVIPERVVNAIAGRGDIGVGLDFEEAIIGLAQGNTYRITVENDPSLAFDEIVKVDNTFGPSPLVGEIPTSQFTGAFGDLQAGDEFTPGQSFFSYRVESRNDDIVVYRALPEDGQRNPIDRLGATLVTYVNLEADTLTQVLEANPGQRFKIDPPSAFNPETPLGLAPGAYEGYMTYEGQIAYRYSPALFAAALPDSFVVVFTPNSVVAPQADAEPMDGNYGVRTSYVIRGVPEEVGLTGMATQDDGHADHQDDGHHDDGHRH